MTATSGNDRFVIMTPPLRAEGIRSILYLSCELVDFFQNKTKKKQFIASIRRDHLSSWQVPIANWGGRGKKKLSIALCTLLS